CLQQLELKDVILRTGDQLKIKGFVLHDADRFHIDLGNDANELALHFNPRFHDNADGSVLVFNSKTAGCWGEERREIPNPLHRGKEVRDCLRIVVMFCPKSYPLLRCPRPLPSSPFGVGRVLLFHCFPRPDPILHANVIIINPPDVLFTMSV
uniref:Galectin n=1 Tax=Takifugu rubripes TaxID=31033 RepID=A0A674N699_TAKRU